MFVCVGSLALGIQLAQRMRRITLPSVTPLAVPYFLTLSHTRQDFWKRNENKI